MTLIKRLACGAALATLALAAAHGSYAQETAAAMHGRVTLADGAPAGNATITIVHVPSGTRALAVTDESGVFDTRGLRIGGPYTVTSSGAALESRTVSDIYLTVGETTEVDIDYAPAVQEVVVTARRGTSEQGPKTVLDRESIAAVATINRDIRDLARRDILVSQNIRNDGGISIAGSNPRTNRITIDGVSAQDPYGLETGGLPTSRGPISLDAVEQFSIAAVPTDVANGNFTGGAMNIVLRSGGNTFHGSLFTNILTNSLVGTRSRTNTILQNIQQQNYGGFLSGPLWRDRLFFAVSYEKFTTSDQTTFGPPGEGFANSFNNITRAQIDTIVGGLNTDYVSKYTAGDLPLTEPVTDVKYSGKLDLNIADGQRASLTYRHADSSFVSRTDISATTAALFSHWYDATYDDNATTLQLNSRWTDRLSTDVRITSRKWVKGQDPVFGANYSDVSVCTQPLRDVAPTDSTIQTCATGFSIVRYGPDLNRHANQLHIEEQQFQGTAVYRAGMNTITSGYQMVDKTVFNLFLPNSLGTYTFDSIEDFKSGTASKLVYQNAITGNPVDAAANLKYRLHSAYLQDTAQLTNALKIVVGVRADVFKTDDVPILNPNFVTRNGFANTKTISGQMVVMPRISAEWKPDPRLKLNAGGGLFSGGFPEVLFATPYYNTGYATSTVTIQRCTAPGVGACTPGGFTETSNATSITPGFSDAVGSKALNNLQADPKFGSAVPQIVRDFQQGKLAPAGAATISPTTEVIALSPSFHMPGEWKAYLTGQVDLGHGWDLNAEYVGTSASNTITFVDLRVRPLIVNGVQQLTPDGRIRYDGLTTTDVQRATLGISSTNPGGNRDLVAQNRSLGNSYIAGFKIGKRFDWGLDASFGMAIQNINELNPGLRFGTTASSLYASVPAGLDPNRDQVGRGIEEVGHRYMTEVGYRHNFFGDNETRVALFGQRTTGRPFGFTMNDAASGRSPVFGVVRTAQALYIPDIAGDIDKTDLNVGLVTFATAGDRDRFLGYVQQFKLPTTPGILPRYYSTNKITNRLDLQISQELPTLWNGHKIKVQVDVRNLLNLMNNKWGRVEEYFDGNTLTRVACATSTGAAAGATSPTCARYLYSQVPTAITPSLNPQQSVWYAQVGLRYEF